MKTSIYKAALVLSIVVVLTAFAGSASAAPRHHHHRQAPRHSGTWSGSQAPRIYAPYASGPGYARPMQGSFGVPHHDYYRHDFYHDSYHGYGHHDYYRDSHHGSHHGW